MARIQTLEDNYGSEIGGFVGGAGGTALGIPPQVGAAVGSFLGSFFDSHKNPNPTSEADKRKQLEVVSVWKKRLNSMGYPITLEQSKAILGSHWGGNFKEILAQYQNFVRRAPAHGVAHPYGTSWNQFVSLFPTYDRNIVGIPSSKFPPVKYPAPYNFTPSGGTYKPTGGAYNYTQTGGQNNTAKAGISKSIFPILIIVAAGLLLMGGSNG
jgi:hypothetical protein